MKKIKIFSTIALSLALASCDNFELPNPPAQSNPDPGVEGVFENSGLRLSQSSADVNLIEASNKNENVAVARIDELVNFPEGYDLRVDMQVAGNDQFGKYATVKTTIADNLVYVNPTDFDSAIQEAITRNPAKLNVATRFVAYAERGTTLFRLGGMDEYYGRYEYSVKPLDPAKTLEQDYYLVGSFCNWDPRKAIKFNNTVAGANIYDNPVLAVRVEITEQQAAAGYEFKVIPASSALAGNFEGALGCIADETGLAGKLTESPDKSQPGVLNVGAPMLITINIQEDSYSISYALDVLYPLSDTTISKPDQAMLLYTDNYITFSGTAVLAGSWYCAGEPSIKGLLFRQNKDLGVSDSDDGMTRSGYLTADSDLGEQLRTPVKGTNLYWVDVNLVMLTYKISAIQKMSVIGDGNGWDLGTATELTPSKDLKVWSAQGVQIGNEFKINCNGAWDLDFGGEEVPDLTGMRQYNVVMKGGNCPCTPGTYDVEVDFSTRPYTVTLK